MKQLSKTIGRILFYIFILAVAGWTASLTLAEVKEILPGDPITPYFALALFDGGAITWLFVFLGHAKGLVQRAVSLLMLVLDLAGVVVLSAGRLLMGGQDLAEIPPELGEAMVWALIAATLINLVAIYVFHIADPETMQQIELQTLDDTIQAEALSQARANIENEVQALGAILAARSTARLKYSLRLQMNDQEARELLTDGQSPAPLVIPAQKKRTQDPGIVAALRRKFKRPPQPVAVYEQTVPEVKPQEYGPEWENSTEISPTLDAYAWVCLNCDGHNRAYTRKCQWCEQPRTNKSPVTAFADIPGIPKAQEEPPTANDAPFQAGE